jgi:hypothetical protein
MDFKDAGLGLFGNVVIVSDDVMMIVCVRANMHIKIWECIVQSNVLLACAIFYVLNFIQNYTTGRVY